MLLFVEKHFLRVRSCKDCSAMKIIAVASDIFRVLEVTSILHILVLVYLRLLSIRQPLSTDNRVIQLRKKLIMLIWMISLAIEIWVLISFHFEIYGMWWLVKISITMIVEAVPLIVITVMNFLLIRALKKKKQDDLHPERIISNKSAVIENYDRTTIAVKRLALFLLISYTPYFISRATGLVSLLICKGSTTCYFGNHLVRSILMYT